MKRISCRLKASRLAQCCGLALMVAGTLAQAQTIYRIVGPDGKVTFSDQPAAVANAPKVSNSVAPDAAASGGSGESTARLPLVLRKVTGQFPVVLYASKDCGPCNSGRNLLMSRGVPFSERTIENRESIEALRQLSGQGSLPLLTIGSQQIKGYSDTSWSQYLNAAGYPEKSVLPSNYRQASPTPLAQAKEAEASDERPPAKGKTGAVPVPAETPVVAPTSNPAGIRF